jgi:hypothetical protein
MKKSIYTKKFTVSLIELHDIRVTPDFACIMSVFVAMFQLEQFLYSQNNANHEFIEYDERQKIPVLL